MLIRSVRAVNFMRFSRLQIEELPEEGVIGIEGPNESGKSTIGEAIIFAFFGRARASRGSSVMDLIRWGNDSLRVEVAFYVGGSSHGSQDGAPRDSAGGEFLIYREIDKQGTNYVKVLALPGREEVATGNVEVEAFLSRTVRVGFDDLQQSFYHDQYDSRRPKIGEVAFFERATGIDYIQEAGARVEQQAVQLERELSHYQEEIQRNRAQVEKYERNVQKLEVLNERLSQCESSVDEQRRSVEELGRQAHEVSQEASTREKWGAKISNYAGRSPEDLRDELASRLETDRRLGDSSRGAGLKEAIDRNLARLQGFHDFTRDAVELLHLAKDERAELRGMLQEDSSEGPLADFQKIRESVATVAARCKRLAWFSWALLLLAVPLVVFAVFVVRDPAALDTLVPPDVASALKRLHESLTTDSLAWVPWAAGAAAVLALLASAALRVRSLGDRAKLREAEKARDGLALEVAALEKSHEVLARCVDQARAGNFLETLRACGESERRVLTRRTKEIENKHQQLLASGEPLTEFARRLGGDEKDLRARLADEKRQVMTEKEKAAASLKKAQSERSRVQSEVRECQSQEAKKQAIEEKTSDLETRAEGVRTAANLERTAARLLEETAGSIRNRMRPSLARLTKSVLPRLTGEHYREVKVEDTLEIRVFSPEKGDFVSLQDLSGGTNEALGLAVRLALSQTLIRSRVLESQFVFLDEPFKMMDSNRVIKTLESLRELSPDLKQFFVLQPRFSDDERGRLDGLIKTSSEQDVLEVGGASLQQPQQA